VIVGVSSWSDGAAAALSGVPTPITSNEKILSNENVVKRNFLLMLTSSSSRMTKPLKNKDHDDLVQGIRNSVFVCTTAIYDQTY
jgi:hypothetical protein